jgi:hypothetical protein
VPICPRDSLDAVEKRISRSSTRNGTPVPRSSSLDAVLDKVTLSRVSGRLQRMQMLHFQKSEICKTEKEK